MKLIKYFAWLLWGVSLVILILFLFGSKTQGNSGAIGIYLTWSYILTGIAALAAILLPLVYMVENPKMLIKTSVYIGIMLVVGIISYLLATETLVGTIKDTPPNEVKWTETGLIAMYFFLAIVSGSLLTAIKNR